MKVGFYSRYKNDPDRQIYIDILQHNGIEVLETSFFKSDFWDTVNSVDAFIFKWGNSHDFRQLALTLLPIIEMKHPGKVFPDQATCWHYDNKICQDFLLKQHGFPFVDSWVFYDKESALHWAESASYPVVFKLTQGSGSWNVFLVHDQNHAIKLVKQMFGTGRYIENMSVTDRFRLFNGDLKKLLRYYGVKAAKSIMQSETSIYWMKQKNYIYFQKFCADNKFDTRVTTAGLRAHAFRRFVRKNDFRASGSNSWDINPDKIDMRMVKTALEITAKFGFQSMAYDFVYDLNNEPKIVEISYAYGRPGFPDFSNGYWDKEMNWHSGRFWPQLFELEDLLGVEKLKMPTIDISRLENSARIIT